MRSEAWSAIREQALIRDNYLCRDCDEPAAHVHHMTYERFGHEDLDDLRSLCVPCHDKRHNKHS